MKKREKENERKRMRGREYLSFALDAFYMKCKKPFIGFTI